jgi:hypothetical protein
MPSVTLYPAEDGYIFAQYPNNNYGVSNTLRAGRSSTNYINRALIRFDYSSIPAGAIIVYAKLTIYINSEVAANDFTFGVHRALTQWFGGVKDDAPPDPGQDASTWNYRNTNGSVAWAGGAGGAAGSDWVSTSEMDGLIRTTGVYRTFDLTPSVKGQFEGTYNNYGFWVVNTTETSGSNSTKTFRSVEYTTVNQRPTLTVKYIIPDGDVSCDFSIEHQIWENWEAHLQSHAITTPFTGSYLGYSVEYSFPLYADLLNDYLADLNIGRCNMSIYWHSEHTTDWYDQFVTGAISESAYNASANDIVQDNADPNVRNDAGYIWSGLDAWIATHVVPRRERMARAGIHLKFCFSAHSGATAGSGYYFFDDPAEWAEWILAIYDHMQSTFGFTPDAIYFNEPPNTAIGETIAEVGAGALAMQQRLTAAGYSVKFLLPACISPSISVTNWDLLRTQLGDTWCSTYVLNIAYHLYSGGTTQVKQIRTLSREALELSVQTAMTEYITADAAELYQDIVVGGVSTWQQYVCAWTPPDNGANYFLVDLTDPDNPVLTYGVRTRRLRQYMHYIYPNAQRIGCASSHANLFPVAFHNPDGRLAVVIYADAAVSDFVVSGLSDGNYMIEYSTGSAPVQLATQATRLGRITTSIPAAGVITLYEDLPRKYTPALSGGRMRPI